MMFKIAFRNTFRQKRRTILTLLTMFGGFVLAAISIGWSDGSYSYIINLFTRNQLGHIQIHKKGYLDTPTIYDTISQYKEVGKTVSSVAEVEAWAPRLFAAGLASLKDKSSAVKVVGMDPIREQNTTNFKAKLIKGSPFSEQPSHETILGKGLADVLSAKLDDEIVIVSQAADGSIANDIYKVIGILESGNEASDRISFYLHLSDAQELFALYNQVHEIAIVIDDLDQVKNVTEKIHKKLDNPDLSVAPWQEFAKSFYQAMKADQQGMWIMLFVIILIVAVGVLNTVLMSVLERTREYGVLKAVGTKPSQIFWQVIYEVNVMAVVSIIIGIGLSVLINTIFSIHGINIPEPFTYGGIEFKTMYTEVNARSLYIPAITVILSASIVSIFPALRAARIEPARAMRIH